MLVILPNRKYRFNTKLIKIFKKAVETNHMILFNKKHFDLSLNYKYQSYEVVLPICEILRKTFELFYDNYKLNMFCF